jgi:hypothetical protein
MEPWLAESIDNRQRLLTSVAGRVDATGVYPGMRLRGGHP